MTFIVLNILGPVYTAHQHQRFDNAAMTLAKLLSLKTMESLQHGLQLQSGVTPLFSMRTVLLVSLQSCHSIEADAWNKQTLTVPISTWKYK